MGGADTAFLRWYVTALRGGAYPQIRGQLRNDHGYDALGVAVDLLIELGELPQWQRSEYPAGQARYRCGDHETTLIPLAAAQSVGLTQDIRFPAGYTDDKFEWTFSSILELSDDTDYTFSEIADAVEQAFGLRESP